MIQEVIWQHFLQLLNHIETLHHRSLVNKLDTGAWEELMDTPKVLLEKSPARRDEVEKWIELHQYIHQYIHIHTHTVFIYYKYIFILYFNTRRELIKYKWLSTHPMVQPFLHHKTADVFRSGLRLAFKNLYPVAASEEIRSIFGNIWTKIVMLVMVSWPKRISRWTDLESGVKL